MHPILLWIIKFILGVGIATGLLMEFHGLYVGDSSERRLGHSYAGVNFIIAYLMIRDRWFD